MNNIMCKSFSEIDLQDSFFQTLKNDYPEFEIWFRKDGTRKAYVQYESNRIIGFLYLKMEFLPLHFANFQQWYDI